MRGRMNAAPSYAAPVEIGQVIGGQPVCEVVDSNVPNYSPGDIVLAATGWQDFSLSNGEETQKIDRSLGPISNALGVLGMPGFTALYGPVEYPPRRMSTPHPLIQINSMSRTN